MLDELEECIAGQSDVEAYFEISELQKCVNEFVRELPERDGNVFAARYFYMYSTKELARKFHISENNVILVPCTSSLDSLMRLPSCIPK